MFLKRKPDFSGYATKNNIKCSDGRVIRRGAFKDCDGITVPLVWQHFHDSPKNILGHAVLENRKDGVYAYGYFNDSTDAKRAKQNVQHGDIKMMSIWANELIEKAQNVLHGMIREVSLVMHGANPGAMIENVSFSHGDSSFESDDDIIIYSGLEFDTTICHSDDDYDEDDEVDDDYDYDEDDEADDVRHSSRPSNRDKKPKTLSHEDLDIEKVLNSMTPEQKGVLDMLVAAALEEGDYDEEGDNDMRHNLFDKNGSDPENVICHDDLCAAIKDGERYGSMRESFIQHGITNLNYLFPDAKTVGETPQLIARDTGWVSKVMGAVHHSPFSRIKSIFADLTEDDARAKGYIKGNMKKEEFFTLMKRTTSPKTVYKKQKMDRDDIIDITEMNAIAFLKWEMRFMLDEELARAFLVGDGRLSSSEDKINEDNIRPIYKDNDLFTIHHPISVLSTASEDDKAKAFIRGAVKSRKKYKGSGNPTMYMTEDLLADCLLLTDENGRDLYDSVEQLCKKLRVKEIITVPVMENQSRTDSTGKSFELMGIIVNLDDYNVGADKGGEINMFDDFDIDYNKEIYLIETRCSGALIKPYSAIAIEAPKPGNGTPVNG